MKSGRRFNAVWFLLAVCLIIVLLAAGSIGQKAEKRWQVQAQIESGESFLQSADYEDALAAFSRALELDPASGSAYTGRGDTYMALGRYADAVVDYEAANDLGERVDSKLEIAIGEAIREISMESDIETAMRWLAEVQGTV